ncbi:hypothetical protein PanWU01x14_112230 [Parasponia andersonii]|uniref:Uncharacterized protein n=1 Tax=Parasponia andersonii TaxID=3476 RepID=A0A2P5CY88_PARAD|nr:hypothetical protein PanWU01x14_112230 [Parasponia andersonii]
MPPETTPTRYALSPLSFPVFSWVFHKKARRRGASETLATAYPFDHRSSSTIGIVNRLGIVNGISRNNNSLEQENEFSFTTSPSSFQPHKDLGLSGFALIA